MDSTNKRSYKFEYFWFNSITQREIEQARIIASDSSLDNLTFEIDYNNFINDTNILTALVQNLNTSKVFSRYLHSPGSHQSTRFLELLTH